MQNIFTYIDSNRDRFVKRLQELCRQKSISAQNTGMKETEELVKGLLLKLGAEVKSLNVDGGFPAVYGRLKGKGSKTILFYNHYDVQPPEPLHEWNYEPFSASLAEGKLYARGVSDNKGDLIARLSAVEAFLKVAGELPVNIIFLVEGEEEIGSPNLDKIVQDNLNLLTAEISRITAESAREIYGIEPVIYPTSRGTGPMSGLCGKLNIPCVSTGVDYAESNPHAPNENIMIADFIEGTKHIALIMKKFGES